MKQQLIGLVCTLLYVIISSGQGVFVGNFSQHISPTTLCFWCFLIVIPACFYLTYRNKQFNFKLIKKNLGTVLILNVSTAGAWLGFFVAVEFIEPAIAAIIVGVIGPAMVSFISPIVRPGTSILKTEKFSAFCFFAIFLYILYIIFTQKSAVQVSSISYSILGIAAALISSLSLAVLTIYSKKLADKKVTVLQSLSFRFFILWMLSFVLMPHSNFHLLANTHVMINIIIFALIGCLLPVYLVQVGISLLEPIVVSFLFALEAAFTLFLQAFDHRLITSSYSITIVFITTVLSIFAIVSRLRYQQKELIFE